MLSDLTAHVKVCIMKSMIIRFIDDIITIRFRFSFSNICIVNIKDDTLLSKR